MFFSSGLTVNMQDLKLKEAVFVFSRASLALSLNHVYSGVE